MGMYTTIIGSLPTEPAAYYQIQIKTGKDELGEYHVGTVIPGPDVSGVYVGLSLCGGVWIVLIDKNNKVQEALLTDYSDPDSDEVLVSCRVVARLFKLVPMY